MGVGKVKKYIFALLGALAMTFIPQSVNATDSCNITVASGETKTISYNVNATNNSNDCHIANYGTLNIAGGSIYADYGYAINNRGGIVNITGGSITSALHQAIWSNGGTVTVKGGTLKSAGGYEENIYFAANGNLNLCGNYSYDGAANVTNVCPKPAQAPAKTPSASTQSTSETITITITSSEKKTETPKTTVQNTAKTQSVAKSQPVTSTAPKIEEKTEVKAETETETKTETKAEEKSATTEAKTELPSAGKDEKAESNNTIAIVIAATIAVLGSASAAILINRLRA